MDAGDPSGAGEHAWATYQRVARDTGDALFEIGWSLAAIGARLAGAGEGESAALNRGRARSVLLHARALGCRDFRLERALDALRAQDEQSGADPGAGTDPSASWPPAPDLRREDG